MRNLWNYGWASWACIVAGTVLIGGSTAARGGPARPNVLFIAVDDLNDWIGCLHGHPQGRTPHIDRLARRGVLFSQAHCAAPLCNPSRTALLTGLRPSTSGVYGNRHDWRKALPGVLTLPRFFMKHGYHVVGCGKIFHGAFPDEAGWHRYLPKGPDLQPDHDNRGVGGIRFAPLDVSDAEMDDHRIVTYAREVLGARHEKPLFLACGIYKPHMAWNVPRKYFQQFAEEPIRLPQVLESDLDDLSAVGRQFSRWDGDHKRILQSGRWPEAVQAYLAASAFADAMVGLLIDALDASPYADDTIVVLWGDHGWHLGEKKSWRKNTLWDEATRAPLLFVVPGLTEPGSVCSRPVDFMHIYPTLADLCGLPVPDHVEGRSVRALLENPDAEWPLPAITTQDYGNHAVRTARWKYIQYHDGSRELYDHDTDPMEWNNLASDPELADVRAELARWIPSTNVRPAPRKRRQAAPSSERRP